MKNLLLKITVIMLFPIIVKSQAHIGSTLSDIKAMHSDKIFTTNYTSDGEKYAFADMSLGRFFYYFNTETNLSHFCIQVPNDMQALNTQVEIYNKKYVIISETSWKAYLEGGAMLKINLDYNEEEKMYLFYYSN